MSSLCKRNGVFYYWYRGEDGRRKKISTHTSTKSQALEFIRRMHERPVQQTRSLGSFIPEFLEYADATFAPGWGKVYHLALAHLLDLCGNIPLSCITPRHADQYKLKRLKSVCNATVNHELEALRAAFYTALRWEMLQRNPFARVKKLVVPDRKVEFFSPEEFQAFLAAVREQWFKDMLVFTLHTGLRRSEVVNVKWENVDLDRRTILVVSDETFKTKTRRLRVLPMSRDVEELIRRQPRTCPYLFSYQDRQIKAWHITLKFKRIRDRAGLRTALNVQLLRHTYASWMVMKGVSIYHVSKLLGHTTVTTTQRHYASLETSEMHDVVNRVFSSITDAAGAPHNTKHQQA